MQQVKKSARSDRIVVLSLFGLAAVLSYWIACRGVHQARSLVHAGNVSLARVVWREGQSARELTSRYQLDRLAASLRNARRDNIGGGAFRHAASLRLDFLDWSSVELRAYSTSEGDVVLIVPRGNCRDWFPGSDFEMWGVGGEYAAEIWRLMGVARAGT